MANESGPQTRASGLESSVGRAAANRPVWGIVLGALMVLAGLVVLGHVVVATVVSVIFLGWFAVLGGLAGIVASLFRLGKPGFWPTLLGGALALAVGIAFLRRPGLSAAALTLLLGAVLLVGGVTRIVGGLGEHHEHRGWILANGIITLLLGLLILFGWPGSTLWVLGTFLGVDLIVEGVTFIGLGLPTRARPAIP
jgi:uncharacterized membrane protein HdeD (DUF308 family)